MHLMSAFRNFSSYLLLLIGCASIFYYLTLEPCNSTAFLFFLIEFFFCFFLWFNRNIVHLFLWSTFCHEKSSRRNCTYSQAPSLLSRYSAMFAVFYSLFSVPGGVYWCVHQLLSNSEFSRISLQE